MDEVTTPLRSAATTSPSRVTPRTFYRFVAVAEAVTWTGLIAGMVLKYGFDLPAAVLVTGSIHGFVFITYAFTAALIGVNQRWSTGRIAAAVATAIVPFATIPFDRHLERRNLLDGDWHRVATSDPRDGKALRRLLRWLLARPVTLAIVFSLGVIVVMVTMLLIGPPGGWD